MWNDTRITRPKMEIPANQSLVVVALLAALAAIAAPNASAALTVTNGDFETGGGFNANVSGWFDGTIGPNAWDDLFQDTNPLSPQAGTTVVWSGNANAQNFLYQPIGTKEASDATIDVSIVVGAGATGPFTIGIYQSATFSGADGTEVAGASGVTLIDSSTWDIAYAADAVGPEMTTLSLATANQSDPIFLRFHFGEDGMADGWLRGDNITMTVNPIPEPVTTALLGLGGLGLLFGRKRR
ncbi:MAG: PEP-CTERM sorting domain-containing protein [Verrucomicrobia bacterium]|nr:PEP-CTERM sorting domain-containing protein [Verrucomicrobiota bacterium]